GFVLDADTAQPVCCTTGPAARTVSPATPALRALARAMLQPAQSGVLVLADAEHCTQARLAQVHPNTTFARLVPMPMPPAGRQHLALVPPACCMRRWAGCATAQRPCPLPNAHTHPCLPCVQRASI